MKFVYNIEVSCLCNNRCNYCPHYESKRKKGLMSLETFKKCMELVKKTGQDVICLHNFGEPLLHPNLSKFIRIARRYVKRVEISTNGALLTREKAIELKDAGLTKLVISVHNKEIHSRAKKNCKGLGILKQNRRNFYHNWAGTSNKDDEIYLEHIIHSITKLFSRKNKCKYIECGWVTILWDGRINSCFMDMEGRGIIGSVYDDGALGLKPKYMEICPNCHWLR